MKPISQLCEEFVRETLHNITEAGESPEVFYHAPFATMFLVTDENEFIPHAMAGDVYELLESPIMSALSNLRGIAVHSCGWAGTLDEDGNPDNSTRRRVAVVVSVGHDGGGCAVSFEDTDEILSNENIGAGAMAEALTEAWNNAILL